MIIIVCTDICNEDKCTCRNCLLSSTCDAVNSNCLYNLKVAELPRYDNCPSYIDWIDELTCSGKFVEAMYKLKNKDEKFKIKYKEIQNKIIEAFKQEES